MILKMGHLAQSANVRDTLLKREVPFIIEVAIIVALTPACEFLFDLTAKVTTCESRKERPLRFQLLKLS